MPIETIETPTLEIASLARRVQSSRTALLLRSLPDDATTWAEIAPGLNAAGVSTFCPWLRGFGATRFLSSVTHRDRRAANLKTGSTATSPGLWRPHDDAGLSLKLNLASRLLSRQFGSFDRATFCPRCWIDCLQAMGLELNYRDVIAGAGAHV
jgi:hypothetical protein